jgi:hypothetical protein
MQWPPATRAPGVVMDASLKQKILNNPFADRLLEYKIDRGV